MEITAQQAVNFIKDDLKSFIVNITKVLFLNKAILLFYLPIYSSNDLNVIKNFPFAEVGEHLYFPATLIP